MGTIRVERNHSYTTMSNYHLRDKALSLRAIGLLSKMLSLPEDWDYTVSGLAAICKEGRDSIRAALVELENAGYMVRYQTHSGAGTFAKNDYTIYEHPQAPLPGNPSTVEPSTAKPLTGNPPQINKDLNNNLDNILPKAPKRGRREPKKEPDWMPERFKAFWAAYPRGEKKQAAIAAWDKLHADERLLKLMAMALKRQLASEEWQRGIGIPYASTWLNGRRWEDEGLKPLPESSGSRYEVELWT